MLIEKRMDRKAENDMKYPPISDMIVKKSLNYTSDICAAYPTKNSRNYLFDFDKKSNSFSTFPICIDFMSMKA